jgi:hypothetical protein
MLRDDAIRKRFEILMNELKALRNQINILKHNYTKDKTPLQFVLPAHGVTPANRDPILESLILKDVEVIRKFLNALGDKAGGNGLYPNAIGGLEDVDGNEVADAGFVDALKKVVKIYEPE